MARLRGRGQPSHSFTTNTPESKRMDNEPKTRWYGLWHLSQRSWMTDSQSLIVWGPKEVMRTQLALIGKMNPRAELEIEVRPFDGAAEIVVPPGVSLVAAK